MAVILVVDDEAQVLAVLCEAVEARGHQALGATTPAAAIALAAEHNPPLVVMDLNLRDPHLDGIDAFRRMREQGTREQPIGIAVTGFITESYAERCKAVGFAQFVPKPVRREMLGGLLDDLLNGNLPAPIGSRHARQPPPAASLPAPAGTGDFDSMVGRCDAMRAVFNRIVQAAPLPVAVLITGETGTGKEQVAKSIHARSQRRAGPFIPVNCPSIPSELFESELFGHERGAFTGAVDIAEGLVEAARGGTLFLDEIGDLAPSVQAKLLRFLETHAYRRVGSPRMRMADVRIVSATNVDLAAARAEGLFREDLYWRLADVTIAVPPVRDRGPGDVKALIAFIVEDAAHELGLAGPQLSARALDKLAGHEWLGNVREMRATLLNALLASQGRSLLPDDVQIETGPSNAMLSERLRPAGVGLAAWLSAERDRLESRAIADAMAECGGRQADAARQLGIDARTLYTKLRRHGLAARGG